MPESSYKLLKGLAMVHTAIAHAGLISLQLRPVSALESNPIRRLLIVVAKAPTRGQTKTRLGSLIGLDAAAEFYRCLLADVLDIARRTTDHLSDVTPAIGYWPAGSEDTFDEIAPDFALILQQGAALGDRLHHVITQALSHGYDQAAVLSSDTPFVDPAALARGFQALSEGADVALGPCDDGGFYVMHLREPHPEILVPIQMSTPNVTRDILAAATDARLRVELLPSTTDVDTPADLQRLSTSTANWPSQIAPKTREWLKQWQTQQS